MCIHYRPAPPLPTTLVSNEQRLASHVTTEYLSLHCSGRAAETVISEGLVAAYTRGWEVYSSHYVNKGLSRSRQNSGAAAAALPTCLTAALTGTTDFSRAAFDGIREAEFLCSEGIRRLEQGFSSFFFIHVLEVYLSSIAVLFFWIVSIQIY